MPSLRPRRCRRLLPWLPALRRLLACWLLLLASLLLLLLLWWGAGTQLLVVCYCGWERRC